MSTPLRAPRELKEHFGANLKRAREGAGLSQEAAAIRASLHRTEIALLERGERVPRIDTAIRVAGALGVPLGHLLEGIEWVPGEVGSGGFVGPATVQDAPFLP